jgi:glycosyltransferase involved in cell wall biosynthesis
VRDGETGFLVPHGDVAALAKSMARIAGDPALVAALGAKGRIFAERFSWDHAADETEAHLASIAGA